MRASSRVPHPIVVGALVVSVSGLGGAQDAPTERRVAQLVVAIGADTGRAADVFASVNDVKVAKDGRIYVLDATRCQVQAFGANGQHLATFGRRGERPGQFTRPVEIEIARDNVIVRDVLQRKIETFTLSGRHFGTRSLGTEGPSSRLPMRGGVLLVEQVPAITQPVPQEFAAGALDRVVSVQHGVQGALERLFAVRADTVLFKPSGAAERVVRRGAAGEELIVRTNAVPIASRFGAGGAWARWGDSIVAHADGYTGAVTWYAIDANGARVIRRAGLGRTGARITREEIDAETARFQHAVTARRGTTTVEVIGAGDAAVLRAVPPLWSIASKALFAPDGSLWVGVNRLYFAPVDGDLVVQVGEANTWTVFPVSGAAFTVMLHPLFRLTAVMGNRVYGYVHDGVSAPSVEVYEIRGMR